MLREEFELTVAYKITLEGSLYRIVSMLSQ